MAEALEARLESTVACCESETVAGSTSTSGQGVDLVGVDLRGHRRRKRKRAFWRLEGIRMTYYGSYNCPQQRAKKRMTVIVERVQMSQYREYRSYCNLLQRVRNRVSWSVEKTQLNQYRSYCGPLQSTKVKKAMEIYKQVFRRWRYILVILYLMPR